MSARGLSPRRARPTTADVRVLVAMATRSSAVVRKPSGAWWMPGWNAPDVAPARIGRLEAAGYLAPGAHAAVRVLTPDGRAAALAACSPETRRRFTA